MDSNAFITHLCAIITFANENTGSIAFNLSIHKEVIVLDIPTLGAVRKGEQEKVHGIFMVL